jgi:hypothetical protein
MKLALLLIAIELIAIYAYLAGFDAGSQRAPREEGFRGD